MATTTHFMFDKRVQLFKRDDSRVWWCAARLEGVRYRESTKEQDLDRAKDVAEEWYLDLRGKRRSGELRVLVNAPKERTFREAYLAYLSEVKLLTLGMRSPKYVEFMELRMDRHVIPYFGDKPLSSINKGMVQSYRAFRAEDTINCRTSPQMIEQHYAAHIKDRIDASLLNVSRPKAARNAARKQKGSEASAPPTS